MAFWSLNKNAFLIPRVLEFLVKNGFAKEQKINLYAFSGLAFFSVETPRNNFFTKIMLSMDHADSRNSKSDMKNPEKAKNLMVHVPTWFDVAPTNNVLEQANKIMRHVKASYNNDRHKTFLEYYDIWRGNDDELFEKATYLLPEILDDLDRFVKRDRL